MRAGADRQTRTADLILTKDALYHLSYISTQIRVERAAGIEPASSAWKAEVIAIIRCPQHVTLRAISLRIWWRGTDSNHRRQCRQIYSLLPLATREPLQNFMPFLLQLLLKEAGKNGADYRNRTGDLLITSQLLYLLS